MWGVAGLTDTVQRRGLSLSRDGQDGFELRRTCEFEKHPQFTRGGELPGISLGAGPSQRRRRLTRLHPKTRTNSGKFVGIKLQVKISGCRSLSMLQQDPNCTRECRYGSRSLAEWNRCLSELSSRSSLLWMWWLMSRPISMFEICITFVNSEATSG